MSREDMLENVVKYERVDNRNSVCIEVKYNDINNYQFKMIEKNRLEHILPMTVSKIDGRSYVCYDINSKQQFSRIYEYTKLSYEDVKNLCRNISELYNVVEDYMLDIDNIILNPEFMYMNIANKKISFVYYSEYEDNSFEDSMKRLFEYILGKFDHSEGKARVVKVYEIYQAVITMNYDVSNLNAFFEDDCEERIAEAGVGNGVEKESDGIQASMNKDIVKEVEIPTVMKESVKCDVEKKTKINSGMFTKIKIVSVLIVICGIFELFLGDKLPIKLDVIYSIMLIMAGVGIYFVCEKIEAKAKYGSSVEIESQMIPYKIQIEEKDNQENYRKTSEYKDGSDYRDTHNYRDSTDGKKESAYSNDRVYTGSDTLEIDRESCKETVFLSDYIEEDGKLRLINLKDEKDVIEPDRYPFTIGSLKGVSDYTIDNCLVSRLHASISSENGRYFIEDTNSKNGTYLDNERLKLHELAELKMGDIVTIAKNSYVVEIC